MIWESFGGWFNDDPQWLQRYKEEKQHLSYESGLTEEQLDKLVGLFVQKDILRMN